jgi:hypothetical protein
MWIAQLAQFPDERCRRGGTIHSPASSATELSRQDQAHPCWQRKSSLMVSQPETVTEHANVRSRPHVIPPGSVAGIIGITT